MTQQSPSQWVVEPRERGWLGRLIAPHDGGHPATVAFLLGALGAAAFTASMVLDWQKVTVQPLSGPTESSTTEPTVILTGLGSVDTLSLVYVLGCVGLLGLLGAVVARPEQALRMRMAVAGSSVGLLAVTIAIVRRLSETVVNAQSMFGALFGTIEPGLRGRIDISYEAGMFCAFGAVLLPLAAIFLAARPAARSLRQAAHPEGWSAEAPHRQGAPLDGSVEAGSLPDHRVPVTVDGARHLSVTAEPLDLSVSPSGEAWPR